MATITFALSSAFTTGSGTKSSFTPAAVTIGDLAIVITTHTGNTSSAAPTDDNSDGLGTYSLINSAVKNTSADTMRAWVRDAPFGSTSTTTITHAPGTTTGGGLLAWTVSGITRVGTAAIRQSAKQDNQAGGGTPTPVLGSAALTNNPLIGAVFNATNVAGITPRSSPAWTEDNDGGYNSPATGREAAHIDSGETATSIAWGSTSASAFCSIVVELDSSVPDAQPGAGVAVLSAAAAVAVVGFIEQPNGGGTQPPLTIAGQAPTALLTYNFEPGSASLAMASQAPAAVLGSVAQPAPGELVISGEDPTASRVEWPVGNLAAPTAGYLRQRRIIALFDDSAAVYPPVGALAFNGQTPNAIIGSVAQPSAGGLVIAATEPSALVASFVEPGAGALTASGQAPTSLQSAVLQPGLAAIVLTGQAPSSVLGIVVQPNSGGVQPPLTISGQAPTIVHGNVSQPGAGALVFGSASPSATVRPAHGAVGSLAAADMGYLRSRRIVVLDEVSSVTQPDAGALMLFGAAPSAVVDSIIAAGQEDLTLSGLAPNAVIGLLVQPSAGALTIGGEAPSFGLDIAAQSGEMTIAGLVPSAEVGGGAQPGAAELSFTGLTPTTISNHVAEPEAGALSILGALPSVVSSSPALTPDAGVLAIFGHEPTIVVSIDGLLSAKYLGGRRKNVSFKPLSKKNDEPKKTAPEVKPSPLLLGLLARGLALPTEEPAVPPPAPPLAAIEPPPPIAIAPPVVDPEPVPVAPPPSPEEILQARVDSLEQQMHAMRAEVAALRAPVAAPPSARDPVAEAMHAILPAIGRSIDLDAPPPDGDEPTDELAEAAPTTPRPQRPKMTREEIDRENERRAEMAAELLL